jgi:long-chain acyl-CoA synthetase
MSFKPRHTNLVQMLATSMKTWTDRPLFGTRTGGGWQWTTYREFGEMVDRCRAGLASLGVGKGDRVAAISANRLEWAVAAHATYGLTAIYVPIHHTQLEQEWKYILQDSGARICFIGNDVVEKRVRALQADLHDLEHIVNFEGNTNDKSCFSFLLQSGTALPVTARVPNDRDIASFIYTAGISGNPKGVKLSHYNLASNASAMIEAGSFREGEVTVALLPWAHVLGGVIELNILIATGGSMAICDTPDRVQQYMEEIKPTGLFAVPRVWNRIRDDIWKNVASQPEVIQALFADAIRGSVKKGRKQGATIGETIARVVAARTIFPRIRQRLGGRIRFATSGGAALSRDTQEFLAAIGIPVYQGYGLTECSGCATTATEEANRPGSVGKPIPGVTVRLDRNVDGAAPGEGEVIIFGSGVMMGYHNLPQETLETITKYGGVRTGDIGRVDKEGFLYITGSLKELFKLANGRYVAPAPLEERLQGSPYIAQCMIYGANQAYNVALIVPDMAALMAWGQAHGMSPFVDTLFNDPRTRRLYDEEVAKQSRSFKGFERIREFALLGKEFTTADGTLTPTLELKRNKIVEMYREKLKELYAPVYGQRATGYRL